MTEDQKEQLKKIADELYETIKPVIDRIYEILKAIANTAIEVWKQLEKIVTVKVSIKTKKYKKGKKYTHSYKKMELWRCLV